MKLMKVCMFSALAVAMVGQSLFAQQTTSSGRFTIQEIDEAVPMFGPVVDLSPTVGASYFITHGLGAEDVTGADLGYFFGTAPDLTTGAFNDAIMDGDDDVIASDLADVFGAAAPNEVIAYECLEFVGVDAGTGQNILRLTVGTRATGTEDQYDSLDIDVQDEFDLDLDGITGKGPDGIFGTADDVDEPDGFFDTGDGMVDATFPLDPAFLVFLIDVNGNGDPNDDPPSPASRPGLFIGENAGGTNIQFDNPFPTVVSANWEVLGRDGMAADIDGDGIGDGPFDVSGFAVFTDPLSGGWSGAFGVGFGSSGISCAQNLLTQGTIQSNQLVVEYLSPTMPKLFCSSMDKGCEFDLGDVNMDGSVDLLDVDPFVAAVLGGEFICEADANEDGVVDLLDVDPFVALILGG